jgi:hypothetical protein
VIADEATSVVWGMPGAAANAGICAACCRSIRSRQNWFGCFREIVRDAFQIMSICVSF